MYVGSFVLVYTYVIALLLVGQSFSNGIFMISYSKCGVHVLLIIVPYWIFVVTSFQLQDSLPMALSITGLQSVLGTSTLLVYYTLGCSGDIVQLYLTSILTLL